MSTERHEKLSNTVPRKEIKGIKEDPLSKRLRRFDNIDIQFPPNNIGVYINTNEHDTAKTAEELDKYPSIPEAIHIGFSGWHNFDIIAQRRSSRALICDINPENALFLSYALKYLRLFDDKSKFIAKMTQFVTKCYYNSLQRNNVKPKSIWFSLNLSDEFPYSNNCRESNEIALELQRKTSWLYTHERYAHIRQLALQDKIAVITENVSNSKSFLEISRLLSNNSIQVDTVYISNIGEWLDNENDRKTFLDTIQCLLSDNKTILIDARRVDNTLYQRTILRESLPEMNSIENWFFSSTTSYQPKEKQDNTHPSSAFKI